MTRHDRTFRDIQERDYYYTIGALAEYALYTALAFASLYLLFDALGAFDGRVF